MIKDMEHTSLCSAKSGDRCDLHFVVENEVLQTKSRVDKLEEKTQQNIDDIKSSINELVVEMKTYMSTQQSENKFKDESSKDMRELTIHNSSEINDLKVSLKSAMSNHDIITNTIHDMGESMKSISRDTNEGMKSISRDISNMDRLILTKTDVVDIVKTTILEEKTSGRDRWVDSLPAKVSAAAAVLTFTTYFTVKIVVMLLAI